MNVKQPVQHAGRLSGFYRLTITPGIQSGARAWLCVSTGHDLLNTSGWTLLAMGASAFLLLSSTVAVLRGLNAVINIGDPAFSLWEEVS